MEIRLTNDKDINELKKLWREVFDSEGIYTELFIKNRYHTCEAVGMFDKEKLISVLYMLPCTLKVKDREYSMSYIFAVGTLKDERGKGYCSQVMNFAHEYLKNKGIDCASLVPAEKGLFDFYRRLQYENAFYISFDSYHVIKSKKPQASFVSLEKRRAAREKYLGQADGFLSWDESALAFCQLDNSYAGDGETISFPSLGDGYAVCKIRSDHVLIKEIVCDEKKKNRFINAVGNHYNKKKVVVRDIPKDKSHPFGMIYLISDKIKEEFDKNGKYIISLPMD